MNGREDTFKTCPLETNDIPMGLCKINFYANFHIVGGITVCLFFNNPQEIKDREKRDLFVSRTCKGALVGGGVGMGLFPFVLTEFFINHASLGAPRTEFEKSIGNPILFFLTISILLGSTIGGTIAFISGLVESAKTNDEAIAETRPKLS